MRQRPAHADMPPLPRPSRAMIAESAIETAIMELVTIRGAEKSICPSEVARALAEDWQPLLGPVRRGAVRLADAGRIDILRKGKAVPTAEVRGVIRLRLRPPGTEA